MADRHSYDLNSSGDSDRLVISLTPIKFLNDDDVNSQSPDDVSDDVTDSHHHKPAVVTVEMYQNCSDVDDDHQGCTPTDHDDVHDHNYVLDSDYSSDSSQQPLALFSTSNDVTQPPSKQPSRDIASSHVEDSVRWSSLQPRTEPQASERSTTSTLTTANVTKEPKKHKAATARMKPRGDAKSQKRLLKPPYSYAAMSIMAIESSPNKSLMLGQITDAIHDMFPAYFSGEYQRWRNTVQSVLSHMDCFDYKKKHDKLTGKKGYYWQVDLTKVHPECFRRQAIKKAEHMFKPYLHQQLNVPPVILPEHHCVSDTASTPSAVTKDTRQRQQVDATKNDPDFSVFQLRAPELEASSCTVPPKPATIKLNSVSTFPADPDDFLGAKIKETNVIEPCAPTVDTVVEVSKVPDPTSDLDEPVKDLGLYTYVIDSPIASPIPHDVFREIEGPDRYCPSVGSSSSTVSTDGSSTPKNLQPKKRTRPCTGVKPFKKAKPTAGNDQSEFPRTYNVSDVQPSASFQSIPSSQTSTTPSFYPRTESSYQPFASTTSQYHHSFDSNTPLCWSLVDNVSLPFPTGRVVPSLPFGYSSEQFPWYRQTGYPCNPYQTPALYGYPTYDYLYGFHSGYRQLQFEASRWLRNPDDIPLNLSTKPDF